jgi:hypothetical protein
VPCCARRAVQNGTACAMVLCSRGRCFAARLHAVSMALEFRCVVLRVPWVDY